MKQKSNLSIRPKLIGHSKALSKSKVGSDDDWTEVRSKQPSKSNSPTHSGIISDMTAPSVALPVNINLFSQAPDSFFHDEEELSPAATVKLVHSSDLSMNAPSFTPMSEPAGFLDALRTHISTHSPSKEVPIAWTYLDPNRQTQGPFTSEHMAAWYTSGYFPKDLPISWVDPAVYYPLDQVYAGSPPFLSPPSVPLSSRHTEPPTARARTPPPPAVKVVSPPRARGWLWSPEEDVKLEQASPVASLSDIMNREATKKAPKM